MAFTAALAGPALAITHQGAPAQEQYTTTFVQELGVGRLGAGAYEGTLDLTIDSRGLVNGYYRPDGGTFIQVTGGVDGTSVWLDFGFMGHVHVTGTFEQGQIVGYTWIHGQDFVFTARPSTA